MNLEARSRALSRLEGQLKKWQSLVAMLRHGSGRVDRQALESAETKLQEARSRLQELQRVDEAGWVGQRRRLEQARAELVEALRRASLGRQELLAG